MEENNDKKGNLGAIIIVLVLAVGNLVWYFATTSSESIARSGENVIFIGGIVAGGILLYRIIKKSKSSNSSDSKGLKWLKIIGLVFASVLFLYILCVLAQDFKLGYLFGALFAIVVVAVLAILLLCNSK